MSSRSIQIITGDYVEGDKVTGDKIMGNQFNYGAWNKKRGRKESDE